MREHAPGRLQPGGEQEGRPEDRMEAQDVLADDMHVRRPEGAVGLGSGVGVAERGHVVGQRVQPDVDHVLGIVRHRDAPGEAGARYREVLQAALDEADHFVAARGRQDEVRALLVEPQQWLLPGREAKEVARLLDPFDRRPGRRHAAYQLALGEVGLVAHRVPAGIAAEIDLIAPHQLAPERLHAGEVARLGGADEIVVADRHDAGQLAEPAGDAVGERLGRDAGIGGRLLDLLAVLVGAGQEVHPAAVEPREPGDGVARQGRIGVPDVRHVIDVVDRRGDVESVSRSHRDLRAPSLRPDPPRRRAPGRSACAAAPAGDPGSGRRPRSQGARPSPTRNPSDQGAGRRPAGGAPRVRPRTARARAGRWPRRSAGSSSSWISHSGAAKLRASA